MSGTKYYFAARYESHPEMRDYRAELIAAIPSAVVTARWIDCHGGTVDVSFTSDYMNSHPDKCWEHGETDLDDVASSEVIVSFTGNGGRGGRHVEYGYAIAKGLRLVVVGPREHVFHTHPNAEVYATWSDFLAKESQ